MDREVGRTEYQMLTKNNDGEAEIHNLVARRYEAAPELGELSLITQAAPTRITPSRSKPAVRDHEVTAIVPDIQFGYRDIDGELIPLHDEEVIAAGLSLIKDQKPDKIVIQGDGVDFTEVSKYEADSPHFVGTMQHSIDGFHRLLAQLRADSPHADIHYIEGNHEARLPKTLLKINAQLAGIKRANAPDEWQIMSVPFLFRLDELGITYHGGYPAGEFVDGDIVHIHGQQVRSQGSTAELYSRRYPENHVTFGHVHRIERHTRTRRNGQALIAATFGTWASTRGVVPSYGNGVDGRGQVVTHQENWQNGSGIIRRYPDGYIEVDQILIENGQLNYQGTNYGQSLSRTPEA